MKVPQKQPKRGRPSLDDGSCIRLRPVHKDHVWSYDFMTARTSDGGTFQILTGLDKYTRECLAIRVERRLSSEDVIDQLFQLIVLRGVIPDYIRSDNGPEFTAKVVRKWLGRLGVKTLFIEPGSAWENGYIASFNGKLRDELLNREIFTTLAEAKVLIEWWRRGHSESRRHSAKRYQSPTPVVVLPTGDTLAFQVVRFAWADHRLPRYRKSGIAASNSLVETGESRTAPETRILSFRWLVMQARACSNHHSASVCPFSLCSHSS